MVKKFYTIEVDNENLKNTAKSKSLKTKKSALEKETEAFGVVEINNASSKNRIKNNKCVGFEKNVTNQAKKQVKSQLHEVEDYFDFSFKPEVKVEEKVVKKTTRTRAKKQETTVLKAQPVQDERTVNIAEVCDRINLNDDEIERIVCVARIGSLFDCDKRILNKC